MHSQEKALIESFVVRSAIYWSLMFLLVFTAFSRLGRSVTNEVDANQSRSLAFQAQILANQEQILAQQEKIISEWLIHSHESNRK